MSEYVDLDELKDRVYFHVATLDPRFVWRKIYPVKDVETNLLRANPDLTDQQINELGRVGVVHSPVEEPRWSDGLDRFMIVDCAHREADRVDDACGHCGKNLAVKPAPRKRGRK